MDIRSICREYVQEVSIMEELKVNYELSELVRSVISMDENSIKKLIQLLVASSPESSFIPLLKSFRDMQNLSSLNQELRYTGSLLYQAALITSILFDYNYIIRDPKVDEIFEKYKYEISRYSKVEEFFQEKFGKDEGMLMYGLYLNFGKRWNIARFLAHVDYMMNYPDKVNELIDNIEKGKIDEILKKMF